MPKTLQQTIVALNAVTATTTSAAIPLKGVRKATLFLTRAAHSAGNTAFTVTVSGDDTTYVGYNKLVTNVTNTNSQTPIRVATVTLSSNTTETVSMDLALDALSSMKVVATETTDGTHTAKVVLEYL